MLDIDKKKKFIDFIYQSRLFTFNKVKHVLNERLPYTIDLRKLCSYPDMLKLVARMFGEELADVKFDLIAGPYTDIPLGTTMSLEFGWPMVFVRKERKTYGMGRLIEGNFEPGQTVVVIDDEITDVVGTLQLLGRLEGSGLRVARLYVLLDRDLGSLALIRQKGYQCKALISLSDIFLHLTQKQKISVKLLDQLVHYLRENKKDYLLKFSALEAI